MSISYFKDHTGLEVMITNTVLDDLGVSQSANNFLLDNVAASHQVFYDGRYPTSLVAGSKRRFKTFAPRVFKSGAYKQVFKT